MFKVPMGSCKDHSGLRSFVQQAFPPNPSTFLQRRRTVQEHFPRVVNLGIGFEQNKAPLPDFNSVCEFHAAVDLKPYSL